MWLLLEDHKKYPFIVRSRNAYYEQRKEGIIFYPGSSVKGLQRNLVKGKSGFIERAFEKNRLLGKIRKKEKIPLNLVMPLRRVK